MQVIITEHVKENQDKKFHCYKWFHKDTKGTGFINIFFENCDYLPNGTILEIEQNTKTKFWKCTNVIKVAEEKVSEEKSENKTELNKDFSGADDLMKFEQEKYNFGMAINAVLDKYATQLGKDNYDMRRIDIKEYAKEVKHVFNCIQEAKKECFGGK
jgi:hypothetical protein